MLRSALSMTALRAATLRLFERLRDDSVDVDVAHVVAPSSLDEAAAILAAAAEAGIPTAFRGSGTHQGYGNPVSADLVITTNRFDSIVEWRPDDLTVVVQAGVPIDVLEARLAERRQTAVLPETMPGSTVGGAVAVGLSGYRRLRYGPTRDRVLQVRMATGYGKVVTGGSPVVKSSTGYGLTRLVTGSFGSLGLIGEVTLKLWSRPRSVATVEVGDPAEALRLLYRPLAVLQTSEGSFAYLGGAEKQIATQADELGTRNRPGLVWPAPISEPIHVELRVPAMHVATAAEVAQDLGASRWVAQHGVGIVAAGFENLDVDGLTEARVWAESVEGALVVVAGTGEAFDPWGTPPSSIDLQQRIKEAFDPADICNPSILPGSL
jgi:glycolate oxidase FAD binding subunit